MIKKSTLIFLFTAACFAFLSGTKAQNLVPNSGFEVQDTCPAVSQITKAQPWMSATLGTPDLYNSTCSTQNLSARTGIGSAGIYITNTFANNREYMEAALISPMTAGQQYCVSFYVKRLNYRYASDRIGAFFKVGLLSNNSTTGVLSNTPQVDHPQHSIMGGTGWTLVTGTFTAAGGEDHIIIGNFHNDANTDTSVANSASTSKVAYYAIDDISVIACGVGIAENQLPGSFVSVFPNPASEEINFQLTENTVVNSVSLANSLGEEVERINSPENNNGTYTLKKTGLEPGFYFLSIITERGKTTKKIALVK